MRRLLPLAALSVTLGLSACDSATSDTAATSLSAADLQVAATLVGQALGDQSEGMVSDLRDIDAGFDASGLLYGEGALGRGHGPGGPGGRPGDGWRGDRQNGTVTYDSLTGTHRVAYDRAAATPAGGANTLHVDLAYVFTDSDGAFIARPRADRSRVARIVFDGERAGASRRVRGAATDTSSFSRTATWTLDGLTGATATFVGEQTSTGSGTVTTDSGAVRVRTYTVRLRTSDATIARSAASTGNGRPEMSMTGTIAYETVFTRTLADGTVEETRAEGTIDLSTEGRALMRFLGVTPRFDIDLSTGGAKRTH